MYKTTGNKILKAAVADIEGQQNRIESKNRKGVE